MTIPSKSEYRKQQEEHWKKKIHFWETPNNTLTMLIDRDIAACEAAGIEWGPEAESAAAEQNESLDRLLRSGLDILADYRTVRLGTETANPLFARIRSVLERLEAMDQAIGQNKGTEYTFETVEGQVKGKLRTNNIYDHRWMLSIEVSVPPETPEEESKP